MTTSSYFLSPAPSSNELARAGMAKSAALARIIYFENTMHKRLGIQRAMRYLRLWNYYSSQNLPPDNVLQPLSINLYKTICDKHTSYLWGQWRDRIVTLRVAPKESPDPEDDESKRMARYFDDLLDRNNRNKLLWHSSLNSSVFGDAFLRLRWDGVERRVVIESLLPEWVHVRWDVADMNRMTEVIVSYPIDRLDAQEKYGTSGNPAINYNLINPEYVPGFGIFWEHWTTTSYRQWIDDILIREEPNPYLRKDQNGLLYPGILPFIHVPNMQMGGEFYGFADPEPMLFLQDELNRRMADIGDAINNHAHPVVLLKKYIGDQGDLPVGPDAIWDLGQNGEAEYLQWKGSPPITMEYIDKLMQIINDTANMPDIAYGRMRGGGGGSGGSGGGGSSRSGIALQMALMPVVERATMKRIQWDMALKKLAHMSAFIHARSDPATLPFDYTLLPKYEIHPEFAAILPRDQMQAVNANVSLTSGGLRSTQRALEDLGEEHLLAEIDRIKGDLQFKAKLGALSAPAGMPGAATKPGVPKPVGGKNGDKGQGGSNALPGSGASSDAKEAS